MGGFLDQFASFKDGIDKNTFRECFLNLGHSFLDAIDHFVGVGILQHHDLAHHFLTLSIGRNGPEPVGAAILHLCHIFYQDRNTIDVGDHNILNIFNSLHQAIPANEVALVLFFNISSTGYIVVFLDGSKYVQQ